MIPASVAMLLGGSWLVISRVISPLIGVITIVTLLTTPRITTHEPASTLTKHHLSSWTASMARGHRQWSYQLAWLVGCIRSFRE